MSISDLIADWRAKRLSGLGLMRGLVSYENWEIPVSGEASAAALSGNSAPSLQLSTSRDGKTCLMLFSGAEAYRAYCRASSVATEQHFLKVDGTWLFRLPMDKVEQIWIDALSPHDVFYGQEQFARLRDMANAVMIEAALAGLRKGAAPDNALMLVKEYANYYLAATAENGKSAFLMAPDDKGRKLAAIFTADDSFDAFAAGETERLGGRAIEQMQLDGAALFDALRRMAIDGFVFNCAGPVAPVAFAQAVAGIVLEAK